MNPIKCQDFLDLKILNMWLWGPSTPTTALQTVFLTEICCKTTQGLESSHSNNTVSGSIQMSCQRINTSTKVSNSGYTTEYRLKVSLERHYCTVLETEIRVWREVINHNQSTYTSHLAPNNSRLPHYSPHCSHTVPGLTNILINCYLWTRRNLNKICYAQPLF